MNFLKDKFYIFEHNTKTKVDPINLEKKKKTKYIVTHKDINIIKIQIVIEKPEYDLFISKPIKGHDILI